MQKTNVDCANDKLIADALMLCKKLPNDADLGRELRSLLNAHGNRTFFGTAKASNKK
jgi:hypothetical protein